MTGDDAYIIYGAQYGANGAAWKAFDGLTLGYPNSWFSYDENATWIGYRWDAPVTVTKFRIFGAGSYWVDANWALESSNDGSTWVTRATMTGAGLGWNELTGYGTPPAALRWRVRRTNGDATTMKNTEVGELELYGH